MGNINEDTDSRVALVDKQMADFVNMVDTNFNKVAEKLKAIPCLSLIQDEGKENGE